MPIEIEHKFLILNNNWKSLSTHSHQYKQGYLSSDKNNSIRIRISNDTAWINIKSATIGTSRQEYEYEIPKKEASEILNTLCKIPIIEKTRYFVPFSQHIWEIDVFKGNNIGLIVAEIELSAINEHFEKPPWLGQEVTHELRYYNNNLCKTPYKDW